MSAGASADFDNIMRSEHGTASEIARLWTTWDSARNTWKARVNETKQYVYATSTKETTNVQNPWSHSTNIPKITQIYDNLKANYIHGLFPNNDWMKFEGEDPDAVTRQKREIVESYLKTKHRIADFRTVVSQLIDDWILTGNAFCGVTYEIGTHVDPDSEKAEFLQTDYVGPRAYRISPFDIVFNPIASSFETSPKIIRSIKTVGELKRDVEEKPELGYEAEIFSKVTSLRSILSMGDSEEVQKYLQLEMDGFGTFGQYVESGYVELLDFYGDIYDKETDTYYKNYMITVVDRKWVIRKEPLKTWSGSPHIYHVGWRNRADNLWAMGPLDNLVGMQYRINHLENARADAFDQMIAGDLVYLGDVQEHMGDNGSVIYEAPESGDVKYLAPDVTILNADFQIKELEDKMELYAGAPREAMGVRTPGEKTAFEVQSLLTAAGRIFQDKMTHFEVTMLEKIINAEVEVARRNLQSSDLIKIVDEDTGVAEFMTVTKEDIMANGKLVPIGARHFARQAQLAQDLAQFQQSVASDPMILQHFSSVKMAKLWEDLLGLDQFNLFSPNIRIFEQTQMQELQQIAQQQLQESQMLGQQMAEGQPV